MPEFRRFNLNDSHDLQAALQGIGARLPYSEDLSVLGEPAVFGSVTLANRFIVQPMEGVDGRPEDGGPSELTFRRYRRFAEGGSALIWAESVAVSPEGCSNRRQMQLTGSTLGDFRRLVDETREAARRAAGHEVVLVLQLTHSGRFSRPGGVPKPVKAHHNPILDASLGHERLDPIPDDNLERLRDDFAATARLAADAGFDGVDIKTVHGYLVAELLGAHTRPGKYGGSYENRTRFLKETIATTMDALGNRAFVTTRMTALEPSPYPYGWGVKPLAGDWEPDLTEPKKLLGELYAMGLPLANVSIGWPRVIPHLNRPHDNSLIGREPPPEYPLAGVVRYQEMIRDMQAVDPDKPVPTAALSWLRHLMPPVAAGLVREGWCSLVGLGRYAFAYPDAPRDILEKGIVERSKCCTTCSMCSQIMKDGVGRTGCVIRDKAVYGPELRKGRK